MQQLAQSLDTASVIQDPLNFNERCDIDGLLWKFRAHYSQDLI